MALLEAAGMTVDLTPPAGLAMGGYVLRQGATAVNAHDPLEGSLVWLRDPSGGEILWVGIDVVGVDETLTATIAERVASATGCDPHAVLVCASHTHSSAAGWFDGLGPFLPDQADAALRDELVDRLAAAAAALPALLEPVWPVLAEGSAPDAGGNRNDPAGPHDASVGTLALADGDGRVAAVVINYASHATVLGYANLAWSADWPGAARRVVAEALTGLTPFPHAEGHGARTGPHAGRRPTVVFLQGAAGDASARFVRRGQTFAEVDRLGGLVGAAAVDALLRAEPRGGPVVAGVRERSVTIPTRQLPSAADAAAGTASAERNWHATQERGASAPEERIARTRYEGALMLATLAESGLPPTVNARISVAMLGDAAWVHLPVELFASFGLAIRAASPFAWTRVIGYTGGYFGYVADAAAHASGVYEASASLFDPAGGQALVDAAVGLLREAAAQRSPAREMVG
jgi:hypothetical protein